MGWAGLGGVWAQGLTRMAVGELSYQGEEKVLKLYFGDDRTFL